jgi:hypothetical protein
LLHKVFRSVATEPVATSLENLGDFYPQEHIESISSKIQELELLLEKTTTELSAIGPRVRTRVRHFAVRLTTLLNWATLPENISVSVLRELILRLEAIEKRTIHYSSNCPEDRTVAGGMMQHQKGAAQICIHDDVMRHSTRSGESDVAISIQDSTTESTMEANSTIRGHDTQLNNPRAGENLLLLPWRFNKLPHPVDRMLKQLPLVDGLEVNSLLQFLKSILQIRAVFTVTDQVLLQVIYPYCKKPLSNRAQQALSNDWNFDQFHEDVICSFDPRRRFDRLRQEMFGRLQREDESLVAYSDATKQAAQVLR